MKQRVSLRSSRPAIFVNKHSSFYTGVDDDFVRGEVTSPYFVYIHQVYYQAIASTLVHAIGSWVKLLTHTTLGRVHHRYYGV